MQRKRTPTLKQIKTLQLVNQGMTVHRAMKEAGYKKRTYEKSSEFMKSPVVKQMIMNMGKELRDKGLTEKFMAGKFEEWINAKQKKNEYVGKDDSGKPMYEEVENPDYDTQIKAYDRWDKAVNPNQITPGTKRKLTIEEFVTGEEPNHSS